MRQHILSILSLIALSIYPLSLSSQNSFSPSLDMNTASGNQAVTSVDVSASQDVAIQLFGNGMQSARGISARFEYDASQVTYQGFDAGNMLPSEQVFTEHGTNPTVVQISVVPVGSVTTNSGLVGTIRFRTRGTFSGTSIQLVQGELGKSGQVESVMLNVSVELQSDLTSSSSDFDGNGRVGFSDFWAFATKFGSSHGDGTYESKYDLDSDDAIGLSDFMLFANVFGKEVSSSDSGSSTSKMYWTDRGTRKIQRADLDGSNVEALVTTGLGQPNDIVLDIGGGKMYWTDYGTNKIQRSDLDGSNVEDLVTTGTSDLQGLALDVGGGKMYWTLVNANKIQRSDLDGSNVEDLVTTGLSSAWDIVLDARGGKMYWVDNGTDKIQRSDLDGSNVEDLITTGLSRPEGLALDMVGGKMYWTDDGTNKIQRSDLDGSNVEDLVTTGLNSPAGIALDMASGKMYWTDDGTNKIQRSDLDGSNVEDLVTTGLNSPAGIALDMASGKMYWTDDGTNKIQRSDLDGSNVEDLVTSSFGYPTGIALDASLDLIVKSPSVSNSNPNTDQSFTLSATVRNLGTDASPATTLRYYRSTDATISTDDTEVGTDAVSGLSASGASDQSVSLTAPSTPGTYYYGACVESVTGE
ncbi:MAG: hypothetical protein OXH16_23395, partial [Gemmatimonadetes bacterium]|nr:hypothetical protein [Gemmatimonadota bacterium]